MQIKSLTHPETSSDICEFASSSVPAPALARSSNSRGAGARQWLEAQADGGVGASVGGGGACALGHCRPRDSQCKADAIDRSVRTLPGRARAVLPRAVHLPQSLSTGSWAQP